MFDGLQGKFEVRLWLGILLIVVSLLGTVLGDQATFVEPPRNSVEAALTLIPSLSYALFSDRLIVFAITLAVYAGGLGAMGYGMLWFMERHVFEPIYFRRMVQTKQREERLINRYVQQSKP